MWFGEIPEENVPSKTCPQKSDAQSRVLKFPFDSGNISEDNKQGKNERYILGFCLDPIVNIDLPPRSIGNMEI
jgi:hypothetical protein